MAAEKEYGLEKALAAMKDEWSSLEFEVRSYKETGTFLVTGVDDIVTLLDDHLVKTQTMRGSPYILPIEAECKVSSFPPMSFELRHRGNVARLMKRNVMQAMRLYLNDGQAIFRSNIFAQAWEYRLKYAQGLVDEWIDCQRTWLYLEPIFSSEDIMRQLPTEARRFNSVDQLWKKVTEIYGSASVPRTNEDPAILHEGVAGSRVCGGKIPRLFSPREEGLRRPGLPVFLY